MKGITLCLENHSEGTSEIVFPAYCEILVPLDQTRLQESLSTRDFLRVINRLAREMPSTSSETIVAQWERPTSDNSSWRACLGKLYRTRKRFLLYRLPMTA